MKWLKFLRKYGPVARNDNMYDETIRRSAHRAGIDAIHFKHPTEDRVLSCFGQESGDSTSVILTGTAGDGKTHLCREVWQQLAGDPDAWASDDPYLSLQVQGASVRPTTIHFIRDLSGWAPQQGLSWEPEKERLLQRLSRSIFDSASEDLFLIAANDGQLVEAWRRLADSEDVIRTRKLFEDLLVEDRQEKEGARLQMFNLSRGSSADLFDRAYAAFVSHSGWSTCYEGMRREDDVFGPQCPIRRNYELLKTPLVQSRLRALIELCDQNGLHLPIRQILLMLSNAVLGHPDCRDHLMKPADVPKVLRAGTVSKASLYNNIFGGNLSETRRQAISIFDYFERFQIGFETSNRIDNILIFGEGDPVLGVHFQQMLGDDKFYGADHRYYASRDRYIEGAEEDPGEAREFLELLIAQRRGLFFKIPDGNANELNLWELTVFRFAGEYLTSVLAALREERAVKRSITGRLIKGLNRIFTGMLVSSERELFLATSGNYSQAKISRVLCDKISVEPRHGERVSLGLNAAGRISLTVHLNSEIAEPLELNLVRFEFLSRVATEGALPASFSKECYEDILLFKSRLLAAHQVRREREGHADDASLGIRLLSVNKEGTPEDQFVEVQL